jgi:hypothetical protein
MVAPEDMEWRYTLRTAVVRYDELRMRDTLGADTPEERMTKEEALELLALSELIARKAGYGRQLAVRTARAAGASWSQIGTAMGTSKQSAWESHLRWIEEQGA